jgi:hypothetical protein
MSPHLHVLVHPSSSRRPPRTHAAIAETSGPSESVTICGRSTRGMRPAPDSVLTCTRCLLGLEQDSEHVGGEP